MISRDVFLKSKNNVQKLLNLCVNTFYSAPQSINQLINDNEYRTLRWLDLLLLKSSQTFTVSP